MLICAVGSHHLHKHSTPRPHGEGLREIALLEGGIRKVGVPLFTSLQFYMSNTKVQQSIATLHDRSLRRDKSW